MSDELDDELRHSMWRNRCPNITPDEAFALEPVRERLQRQVAEAGGARRIHTPSGPEWMLAGYRAGWRHRAQTAERIDVNDLVVCEQSAWPEQRFVVLRIERGDDGRVEAVAQACPPFTEHCPIVMRAPREHFRPADVARDVPA